MYGLNNGTKWGTVGRTIRITKIKYINLLCADVICFVIGSDLPQLTLGCFQLLSEIGSLPHVH